MKPSEQDSHFRIGDIVHLRSGGPTLTVEEILTDGRVKCRWFDKNKMIEQDFDPITLEAGRPEKFVFQFVEPNSIDEV